MDKINVFQQSLYYFRENGSYILTQFIHHFLISIYDILSATVVRTSARIMISRRHRLMNWAIRLANIIQTIPSLVTISVLIIRLGLETNVVIIIVFLYPLLPIIKSTCTGVVQVDKDILDIGKGMGMTVRQRLFMVELPLSISVIMADIRNALIVATGITVIGAFVGTGGLGDIITRGTSATEGTSIILAGTLPTILMAIITDWLLGILERQLDPASRTSH